MTRNLHLLDLPGKQWMYSEHVSSLPDIPNHLLDRLKYQGYKYISLGGTWTTGKQSKVNSMAKHRTGEFKRTLPDVTAADIMGHPYAPLFPLQLDTTFGNQRTFASFRSRLSPVGLLLDFVASHTARDGM